MVITGLLPKRKRRHGVCKDRVHHGHCVRMIVPTSVLLRQLPHMRLLRSLTSEAHKPSCIAQDQPRFVKHQLAPEKDPEPRKYVERDVFATNTGAARISNLTLQFQRTAKTYLMVAAYNKVSETPQHAGWKSESWVRQAPEKAKSVLDYVFGVKMGQFT